MISGDAWQAFTDMLKDLYEWSDSVTIIGFEGFGISLFDLWISFTTICLFVEAILAPVFGHGNLLALQRYRREDDSY